MIHFETKISSFGVDKLVISDLFDDYLMQINNINLFILAILPNFVNLEIFLQNLEKVGIFKYMDRHMQLMAKCNLFMQ